MTMTNAPLSVGPCPCLPHTTLILRSGHPNHFWKLRGGTDKYENYKFCCTGREMGTRFPWLLRKFSTWYTGNVGISQSAPAKISVYIACTWLNLLKEKWPSLNKRVMMKEDL